MIRFYLTILVLISWNNVWSQKPAINISDTKKWASVELGKISNDGNYVSYVIYNQPVQTNRLIIQSTKGEWRKEFRESSDLIFTTDSKEVIFEINNDTLCLLPLGGDAALYIPHIKDYKLPDAHNEWLAYRLATNSDLVLRNLFTGEERKYYSVANYFFSTSGKTLLLEVRTDTIDQMVLKTVNLQERFQSKEILKYSYSVAKPGNYVFDETRDQLAFIIKKEVNSKFLNELWYYKKGFDSAIILAKSQTSVISAGLKLANTRPEFDNQGSRIFFNLEKIDNGNPNQNAIQMEIWGYNDSVLQSMQITESEHPTLYTAVVNIQDLKILQLNLDKERILGRSNNFALVVHELGIYGQFESYWNKKAQFSCYLVSLENGSRKLLKDNIVTPSGLLGLSPEGKWVIYFDFLQKDYFSYETSTGIIRNITKGCHSNWSDKDEDRLQTGLFLTWNPLQPTWLANDQTILINDDYDIWQIDPSGAKRAVCLTNGFGSKHHIKFRLVDEGTSLQNYSLGKNSTLFFTAFDKNNKNCGFYSKTLNNSGDPLLCSMGSFVYDGEWQGYGSYFHLPQKAKNGATYLVKRMSSTEAPNYYITNDFKTFRQITDIQPQNNYNWYTTELHTWKSLDGTMLQGVLYKPEDFDATRKYPVIFDYYERRSDELNMYRWPKASENRINIPLFVSCGYLVFTPDIHYSKGNIGQSAYNSIVSAAIYLSKIPWVNSKKMGIQGHSFGGFETNYIITHSDLFTAACSASSFSDLISWYTSAARGGYAMYWAEMHQGRLGVTPWGNQKFYLNNSPILMANKVTAPLLMMNNKNDKVVLFSQGIEFFTALRRLGKKVWMLQYDGAGHSLGGGPTAEDFHIRMMQFFDHYLKDSACPRWMLNGIPASMKGIDDGLDLVKEKDKNGKWLTPKEGELLTDEEKKKVEALKKRKPITVTIK